MSQASPARGMSPASTRPPSRPTSRGPSRDSRGASPALSRRSTGKAAQCICCMQDTKVFRTLHGGGAYFRDTKVSCSGIHKHGLADGVCMAFYQSASWLCSNSCKALAKLNLKLHNVAPGRMPHWSMMQVRVVHMHLYIHDCAGVRMCDLACRCSGRFMGSMSCLTH